MLEWKVWLLFKLYEDSYRGCFLEVGNEKGSVSAMIVDCYLLLEADFFGYFHDLQVWH